MRIQKSGDQFSITLPVKVIQAMQWAKGDKVDVIVDGRNALRLVKI